MNMKKWNEEEVLIAIDLLKQNKTYTQISDVLNRSVKSVKEKLNKIGYKLTDFTIKEVKHCLNCSKNLDSNKLKFCSSSCSATFNNKLRTKKEVGFGVNEKTNKRKRDEYHARKTKKCVCCDKFTTNKFCSNECQSIFNRNKMFNKIENGDITLDHRQYKRYLIHTHGEKCMECGWCEKNYLTNKVPIELEHIDGNYENNSLDNLKLLCPNCHSLTPTYKALNTGNGRYKRMVRYNKGKSF